MQIVIGKDLALEPASHENPNDPGVLKRVIATKSELLRGYVQMVNWAELPVGKSFAAHYHEDMQEVFVIASGQAEMTAGDESVVIGPGDTAIIAPNEIHSMKNVGDDTVHYVVFGLSTEQGGKTVVV
jgi:mannose-6-phosphate isomerase-like protein (cupin superfamily)